MGGAAGVQVSGIAWNEPEPEGRQEWAEPSDEEIFEPLKGQDDEAWHRLGPWSSVAFAGAFRRERLGGGELHGGPEGVDQVGNRSHSGVETC